MLSQNLHNRTAILEIRRALVGSRRLELCGERHVGQAEEENQIAEKGSEGT
jgi:hypothetical protein